MLGRGVKRKRSCLEELEAKVLPAAPAAVMEKQQQQQQQQQQQSVVDEVLDDHLSHLQQRQLVLGLCLEKLQRYQVGVELSLRRSVLLINTLRQLQEDVRSDGAGNHSPGVHADSCLLMDDMPVTCPGCLEGDEDDLPLSPPELSPQEADSSPEPQKSLPAATVSAFSDAVNAIGYLGDLALDDIFEDIDTSMYETSDVASPWATGSPWPVSMSLWADDEDVKVRLPTHGSPASLQSCLMDLNDLDHIMEILVKS
ncbi:SERTA domain-containing protein 3 [Solea solea]|uniref:SERTA domain-containing protein 3 n=1 Tax=Solea solea TaxID=90069 RepID=UPI00272D6268|nr:SERTA domain-containing protein 3 [Solea solea]